MSIEERKDMLRKTGDLVRDWAQDEKKKAKKKMLRRLRVLLPQYFIVLSCVFMFVVTVTNCNERSRRCSDKGGVLIEATYCIKKDAVLE